jgi:hypothetical protein
LSAADYRLIAVSLNPSGLREFVSAHHISVPVYTQLSASTIQTLRLAATPETIILSKTGVVEDVFEGAFTGTTKSALETIFSITLTDALLKGQTKGSQL